jgi:two-component system, OmpR family, sensor histidine kinase KdpD
MSTRQRERPLMQHSLTSLDRTAPASGIAGIIISLLLLAGVTTVGVILRLNTATVGFLFLVAVLFIASRQPLLVATVAAVIATIAYNFFFFAPTGTLAVEDPANWIALAAFLLTSLIANRLLIREREQAERARVSRGEVETLYTLSINLLKATSMEDLGNAAIHALQQLGAASGGVILFGTSPQQQKILAWTGETITDDVEDFAAGVGRHKQTVAIISRFGHDAGVPLTIGAHVAGALIVRGSPATRSALESVATLLAFAVERERFVADRAHMAALHESNQLKTSLLQAVSHDLNSPLTVLTVESEALMRKGGAHADAQEHVRVMREQIAQLHRRVDNLLSLARQDAGIITPHVEPTPPADLFRSARESLAAVVQSRPVRTSVAPETPDLLADPSLALEIVVNLVENAHRASPPGEEIELCAHRSTEQPGRVWVEVVDRGPGFTEEQQKALRSVVLSEIGGRSLGIELARRLALLSGGSVEWFPRPGGGTIARLDLPAAAIDVAEEVS